MRRVHKLTFTVVLVLYFVLTFGMTSVFANDVPGLNDIINGQQATQSEITQPPSNGGNTNNTGGTWDGSLPNTGGIDVKEAYGGQYEENTEIVSQFKSALSQFMGAALPILVGIISAALIIVMLLDLLYIVAPFVRDKLAPGVRSDQMGEMQNGMAGGQMGGYGGGQMGGYGGQMGGYGGGQMGGYGGRGRGGYGAQSGVQQQPAGRQWVSQAAIKAVMDGQQPGPDGKVRSVYTLYFKSMIVPLVIVPIMLVLIISGALTNVGFYFGELINNAIQSKVG